MRTRINYNGSVLSKLLLVVTISLLSIVLMINVLGDSSLIGIASSLVGMLILALIIGINFAGEKIEVDETYLYWKPIWKRGFLPIPLTHVLAIHCKRTLFRDGLKLLNNCAVTFRQGSTSTTLSFFILDAQLEAFESFTARVNEAAIQKTNLRS